MKMMILLRVYKSQLKTLIPKHQTFWILNHYSSKRSYSIISDASAFRTSFLETQCGLSGKSLVRASNLLSFGPSDERPNSVLELLQTFGFPQFNITKIISTTPQILQSEPRKVLKPKLDLLVSITKSESELVRMVTTYPNILRVSLKNQIIPAFDLLQSVMGSYQDAVALVKWKPNLLCVSISKRVLPNLEILLEVGVPSSQIVKLATGYSNVLTLKHVEFCKIVTKVMEMGFDLSSSYFIKAVQAVSFSTDKSWETRCELFRSFGFSDSDIGLMFKLFPAIMCSAEKSVTEKLEFFVNKLGWSPSKLFAYPTVLTYSLEKRTIPRCSVLQVLVSKNSTSGNFNLSSILPMTERNFLKRYVTAYKTEFPDIMDAYQGQLKFDSYTFKQNGGSSLKPNVYKIPVKHQFRRVN